MAQTTQAVRCPGCANSPKQGLPPGMIAFGGKAQVCPMCEGAGQLQPTPARIPIWYPIKATLTALQVLVVTQQIRQEADFEWVFIMGTQTGTYTVQLTDGSTGRQITNAAVNNANFVGTAQLPFALLEPYIIARASVLNFILTDTSGAGNTIEIDLHGFSLFPQAAPGQGSAGMLVQS
jgi:hypothetical protein